MSVARTRFDKIMAKKAATSKAVADKKAEKKAEARKPVSPPSLATYKAGTASTPAQSARLAAMESKKNKAKPVLGAKELQGHELALLKLSEAKKALKGTQSMQTKAEMKAALLPEFSGYIEGVLESDAGVEDRVFMTLMIWAIDAKEFALAINMAAYATRHKLSPPDEYNRTTACILVDEFADAALKFGEECGITLEHLGEIRTLVGDQDMPDQVRAKLHKAAGEFLSAVDKPAAVAAFQEALKLDKHSGVKKKMEKLERDIKNAAAGAAKQAGAA